MSMARLIFFFVPYISLGILANIIFFAFFLHLGVTVVALTKHHKFGQCNSQSNRFEYVILICWIIWCVPKRKGLKARSENSHV